MIKRSLNHRLQTVCLAVLCLGTLSACDELLDLAVDCVDDDKPELRPLVLDNPVLNQTYDETIRVSIRNEPFDDSFTYRFSIEGELPDGIRTDSEDRDFRLFGTPIELGEFRFSVRVDVTGTDNPFSNTSGLCRTMDTNNYVWNVQIM